MKKTTFILVWIAAMLIAPLKAQETASNVVMVLHGGAGTILPEYMTPERQQKITADLKEALNASYAMWKKDGSSLDMVVAAIKILEDSPEFNAGRGAVFTHEGHNELDASIMSGKDLNAGAVAGVSTVKNPIEAARAVMESSPHVLLSREGAEAFAERQGLEMADSSWFYTEDRYKSLQRALDEEKKNGAVETPVDAKMGTVGAVAVDREGNISAGTSTGGMTNKRWARIGDSPVIGAGTYADNRTCGVSCTGHGEYFIRVAAAHSVHARMMFNEQTVADATKAVIDELGSMNAPGGLIALDADGNAVMVFNTVGMYRAYITTDGTIEVRFYEMISEDR